MNFPGNLFFHRSEPKSSRAYFLVISFCRYTIFFSLIYTLTLQVPDFDRSLSSSSLSGTDLVPCVIVKTQGHQICPTPSSPPALIFTSHSGLWPPLFIFGTSVFPRLSCLLSFPSISRHLVVGVGFSEYVVCYVGRKKTPPISTNIFP